MRGGHAGVGAVVGEVRLGRRNGGTDVGLGSRVRRAITEAEVGRDRDRQQDADDHDDDEQLDEREAFLTLEPLHELCM